MTPDAIEAFFTVHRGLPREGPGAAEDVHWVIDHLGLSGAAEVLDAGCGPGADLVTFAEALPEARITGVDKTPHFAEEANARVAAYAPRVSAYEGDMVKPKGTYDLIWCAGALYFLGVTEGLRTWRSALNSGGAVAFSEPVLLETPTTDAVRTFWDEYPQITDRAGINALVRDAGYEVQAHRMIVGAPWDAYYTPMQARIDFLRGETPDTALRAALDENQLEIDRWRMAPDQIAYALLIVTPT